MLEKLTIRCEENKVLILSGGVLIAEIPWEKADELAAALRAKARQAEEIEKAEEVSFDTAILMRAGIPFNLTNNKDILKEAIKKAESDNTLRKFMPWGIKSREIFGVPTITQHPKKEKSNGIK